MTSPVRTIGVAIPIPEPFQTQLVDFRSAAGDPLAHLAPPHITLLPPTSLALESWDDALEQLTRVARGAAPFELELRGTGTFRPVTDVVFVAVARGISQCEQLEKLVRCGALRRDVQYPYHPHVTIAHSVAETALDEAYESAAGFSARFHVTHFTLYLHGADSRWRPEVDFVLGDR
ncbi:MAG: 2'-5' RNA ligase family protein [Corynebacteriales bacterium]|nr:2'-5' RNA ligase family protein [Mycobacteriales bacterium]